MELVRDKWTKADIPEFIEYLKTFEDSKRLEWSKNILNTNMKVLCMKTKDFRYIIDHIYKGNYLEFLDLMIWEYYENTSINGGLINKINDFKLKKHYLDIYSMLIDNWASCDLLTFEIKGYEEEYFAMVLEYIKSPKPFKRRMGIYILFNFLDSNLYLDRIFDVLNQFKDEEHYYVNMMLGWLLSECFIKHREATLEYLKNNNLSRIALNKGIQKCRESRRVSDFDKEMLLSYKVKK